MCELSVHLPGGGVAAAKPTGEADDIAEGGALIFFLKPKQKKTRQTTRTGTEP